MTSEIHTYPSGQDPEQAFWRTIIADRNCDGDSPAPAEYGDLYSKLVRLGLVETLKSEVGLLGPYEWLQLEQDLFRFLGTAAQLNNERFCVTEDGYFGMVPDHTEVGDSILVLEEDEKKATFIVRKCPGEQSYKWIGQTYIHHIWEVLDYDELQWDDIVIS